jgi:O-antigen ligase
MPPVRYPVEFGWLLAFAFFLPLFEAPKNLCWIGYALAWLWNRRRDRDWGGAWDRWDTLIAAWIASGGLVATFAGIRHDEWTGAIDILRYGSVLWMVKRSRFDERAAAWIVSTLVVSTLVTLAWGYWSLYVARTHIQLQLNSVGHVNHSAIYLAIVFAFAFSWSVAYWRSMRTAARVAAVVTTLVLVVSLFVAESRAAVGAAALFVLVMACVFALRRRAGALKGTLAVLLCAAAVFAAHPAILKKTIATTEQGLALAYRDQIWRNGLIAWRQYPWFGVGLDNFGKADLATLQRWSAAQGGALQASAQGSHGHSLYFTALAERGVVGLGVLLAVLIAWIVALARAVPKAADPPLAWALFGGALGGWVVTVAAGMFNTTLHHEHAILAVLLLGLWLAGRRPPAPERS